MGRVGADGEGLVDPAQFPCRAFDLDTEAIRSSAGALRAYAATLVVRVDDIAARWWGLAAHYVAPESSRMLGSIGPARRDANTAADVYEGIAGRVEQYADDLEGLGARLARLEERAWAFRDEVKGGVPTLLDEAGATGQGTRVVSWREHGPSVEKNTNLLHEHTMLLGQIKMTAESAANGIRRCHDSTSGAYPTAGGGGAVFVSVAYGSGDSPAVPPDVDNDALRSILKEIYAGTNNSHPVGDGKLATALLNEIETGKKTGGRWHAVDSADQLNRLVELLEGDRKPNKAVSLSPGDRAVALREAGELWRALNSPVSKDSPLYKDLVNNSAARQVLASAERNMLEAPSMKSITGTEFTQSHPKARPVPKSPPSMGRFMGGVGAVGMVFDLYSMVRSVFDPEYGRSVMCQIAPKTYPGCQPPPGPA